MKKRYAVSDLVEGYYFTSDAYLDSENIFVPEGVPIRARDIENLKRWDISHVYSEGTLTAPKTEAPLDETDEQNKKLFQDVDAYSAYKKSIMDFSLFLASLQEKPEKHAVDDLSEKILTLAQTQEITLVSAIISANIEHDQNAQSAVNTAIFSFLIGKVMALPNYRLKTLITGALLHDIGMQKIPEAIVKKNGNLTPAELQQIKIHPLLSYQLVTRTLGYPDEVGVIVLQHHERWDGEGYPRKLKGAEIDILARIVSVADAFEAMISEKPYRNSMIGYQAMKHLMSDNGRRFDPDVLKAFLQSMGVYPVGSLVLLNNSAIARVVENHAQAPLRPKIRLLVDATGTVFQEHEGSMIDLLKEKALFIVRAISPQELK
ncbi:MAG TPA: HD-GYP domain-containing protein [Spirochaetia bacterium]|nr:HD-GYP domain-containing protein [Spirochaetales bacterium]HPD79756.1 HD-GYP domain-containing protein [Spirochaetales bacterium]HRS66567.1 HD-GYP domain-containing protein [Spirochaetia bacterium]HRV27927.1 HD-GYP domain-containing protein [Spirochaetia bacterium]